MWGDSESVVSTCSRQCNKGEERRVKNPNKRCCWDCHVCSDGEYVPDERGHCTPCPAGEYNLYLFDRVLGTVG